MKNIELDFRLTEEEYRKWRFEVLFSNRLYRVLLVLSAAWLVYFIITVGDHIANFEIDLATGSFLLQLIVFLYITVGAPFSVYRHCKKLAATASAMRISCKYIFTEAEILRRVKGDDKVTRIAWDEIESLREYKTVFVFTFDKSVNLVLPKRVLDRDTRMELMELAADRMESERIHRMRQRVRRRKH